MEALFASLQQASFLVRLVEDEFAVQAAHFLAELNAIHPFREGNGRAQLAFMGLLAANAGHSLAFERLVPARFLAAMIESFGGSEQPLSKQLRKLMD